MLEILLVRHGQTDWNVGRKVMGRQPIPINAVGVAQLAAVAAWLAPVPIDAIVAGSALRTQQSAAIIASPRQLHVSTDDAFVEIDYGHWINKSFEEVEPTKEFHQYLHQPSGFTIPGGEEMHAMRDRAIAGIDRICAGHTTGRVVAVSHADVIKTIVVHYLGIPLNDWQRLCIDNSSISILRVQPGRVRVAAVNLVLEPERAFGHDHTAPKQLR